MTSLRDLDTLATVHPAEGLERKDPRITDSLRGQERCLWCWAAVAQFALRWAGKEREKRQCEIATRQLRCGSEENGPDCCDEDTCDEMESLRVVLKRQGSLDKHLRVHKGSPSKELQDLMDQVLQRLKEVEPVAFRVLVSNYKHFIVCNGIVRNELIGDMILIEDPCGPQYTCEPVESFLGKMLYNGDWSIKNIYFLRKSEGTFKC